MKIAFCKTSFFGPVSGADEIMLNYAIQLHQAGVAAEVILLYPPDGRDQYQRRLQLAGVPVTVIIPHSYVFKFLGVLRNLISSVLFFLFFLKRAPRLLRKLWQMVLDLNSRTHYRRCLSYLAQSRADAMHVFTPDSGAALMIKAGHELGIPVLYHEMGTPHHMPMLADYYRRLETVLPLCTEVAALSPRLASDWEARYPFLPYVSVLPLISERGRTLNLSSGSRKGRDKVIFGFAARLEEGKGPLVLLDALAIVNREKPLAVVRIAGMGPQSSEVRERVRQLELDETCELWGNYSDPLGRTTFMSSLDVFVLPSLAEGTPNGVIEAMACGVPVIATNVGGIPDILDPESGILIPPRDADALAEAMLTLASNPELRDRMGAAAKVRCEKLFSAAAVMPLMFQTYARVTRNGHDLPQSPLRDSEEAHPWAAEENSVAYEQTRESDPVMT
jgi:glycosyltransferase involved in cell wall biosynthesis